MAKHGKRRSTADGVAADAPTAQPETSSVAQRGPDICPECGQAAQIYNSRSRYAAHPQFVQHHQRQLRTRYYRCPNGHTFQVRERVTTERIDGAGVAESHGKSRTS